MFSQKLSEVLAVYIETTGKVISVSKQWWFKVNTKPIRAIGTDGAIYPHIIKVRYSAGGKDYIKRKWFDAFNAVPKVGDTVKVSYDSVTPSKAKVF